MDEILREVLTYDPDTGVFRWLVRVSSHRDAGDVAGNKNKRGYWKIVYGGKIYAAHRLAWFFTYGVWPTENIDHINRVRTDNRIANLRLCSVAKNSFNMRRDRQNSSGYKGVYWHKKAKKYSAAVKLNRVSYYLGLFNTAEEAYKAYVNKAKQLHGEFCSE